MAARLHHPELAGALEAHELGCALREGRPLGAAALQAFGRRLMGGRGGRRGGGGPPRTYPLPMGGLISAYEARLAVLDGNDQIDNFLDSSGNGNTLTCPAASGSKIPVATHADFGGTRYAAYPSGGAGNNRLHVRSSWMQGTINKPLCAIGVFRRAYASGGALTLIDGGNASGRIGTFRFNDGAGGYTPFGISNVATNLGGSAPRIVCQIHDAANSAVYVDDPETPVPALPINLGTHNSIGITIAAAVGSTTAVAFDLWGRWLWQAASASDFSLAWRRAVWAYIYKQTNGALGSLP